MACVLAASMANVAMLPLANAGLVATEQVAAGFVSNGDSNRYRIEALFARPEIQAELIRRGVDPAEARKRVAALDDEEARTLVNHLDAMPAGASDVLTVLLVVFIVLLVTDILGLTKIFSFTRPIK